MPVTSYSGSSPPLSIDILAGAQNFMYFAICDIGDATKDSALLVKVEGCVDCNTNIRLAYVTTTTIIGPGDTEVTSTIKASGTVSGTVVITRGEAETTTTEEPTTTTKEEFTTTTEDTTTEDTTTATQEMTTTGDTTAGDTTSTEETTTGDTTTTEDTTIEDTTTTTIEDTSTGTQETTTTGDTTTEYNSFTDYTTITDYTSFTEYTTYTTFIEDTTTTEDTTTATQETITTAEETTATEGSTVASTSDSLETIETTTYPTSATSSDIETSSEPTASILPRQTTTDLLSASSATTDSALESSTVSTTMLSSEITFDPISDTDSVTTTTTNPLETTTLQQTELSSTDTSPLSSMETLTETSSDDSAKPTISQTFPSDPSTTTLLSFLSTDPLFTPTSLDTISGSPLSSTVESASAEITSTFTTSPVAPSNLAEIGSFKFFGCLGSPDGYPSFELIDEGPDMTTIECEKLTEGRTYMGLFLRSCYAADTLNSSDLVRNGRCDLPCPGDPGLFCGGLVNPDSRLEPRYEPDQGIAHRDAPPDILLTLYARVEAISGSSSLSGILSTSEALSTFEVLTRSELGPTDVLSTSFIIPDSSGSSFLLALTTGSSDLPIANPTNSPSGTSNQNLDPVDGLSTLSFVPSTISLPFVSSIVSLDPPIHGTKSPGINPIAPPFPTSASYNAGNFSRTADLAPIVTTIVYTIVDPYDPSYLTVTEFCTTLRSPPCRHCHYQRPATVEMTTIQVDCNACGRYGEDSIILSVPVGAFLEPQTMDSYAHETIQLPYHSPNADAEEESPVHRVRPNEKGSYSAQAHPPDEPVSGAGDEPHYVAPYEFDQTTTYDDIKPTAVGDEPHEVGPYEFDQSTTYDNIQPTVENRTNMNLKENQAALGLR
ncbi:hypothetical protein ACHAPJ_006905 [Fusarium lateritium]